MPSLPSSPAPERDPEAAQLAHDVANDLAAIVARVSVLVKGELSAELRAALQEVLGDAGRARDRLRELLEHARGTTKSRFSLAEVWREVTESLETRGVRVATRVIGEPDAVGNPRQVAEILSSIAATEQATLRPGDALEATIDRSGERLRLEVRSPAAAFSPEELAALRDPFLLRKPGRFGEGLGFGACERVAARNGGIFGLGGAGEPRYRLEIPAARSEATTKPTRPAGRTRRCLVVDDDARVRDSCALMLRHLGLDVETVGSGTEALERLRDGWFDSLILDLNLGKAPDGEEVLAELRRSLPDVLPRTLVATGDPTRESIVTLTGELGIGILAKPFGVDELRRALEQCWGQALVL